MKLRNEFTINGFNVQVRKDGRVKVLTNDLQKQDLAKELKRYFDGVHGNKISLMFEEVETLRKYFSITEEVQDYDFRRIHSKIGIARENEEVIRRHSCGTLFTTNGRLQKDYSGKTYAEQNGYIIVKVEEVK